MKPGKFNPEWEWIRIVEETPDCVDVKLLIKKPYNNTKTRLFAICLTKDYKLPIPQETIHEIIKEAKNYANLDTTAIRIRKSSFENTSQIKDTITEFTAKLRDFCIYFDSAIVAYMDKNSIYGWTWTEAIFNRTSKKFEPINNNNNNDNENSLPTLLDKICKERIKND